MTTDQRIARRKLSLLELAQELGNVSKACKLVGYNRQQFYEIRRNYQTFGAEGLVDRARGPKKPAPEPVVPTIEQPVAAGPPPPAILAIRLSSRTGAPHTAGSRRPRLPAGHALLAAMERSLELLRGGRRLVGPADYGSNRRAIAGRYIGRCLTGPGLARASRGRPAGDLLQDQVAVAPLGGEGAFHGPQQRLGHGGVVAVRGQPRDEVSLDGKPALSLPRCAAWPRLKAILQGGPLQRGRIRGLSGDRLPSGLQRPVDLLRRFRRCYRVTPAEARNAPRDQAR